MGQSFLFTLHLLYLIFLPKNVFEEDHLKMNDAFYSPKCLIRRTLGANAFHFYCLTKGLKIFFIFAEPLRLCLFWRTIVLYMTQGSCKIFIKMKRVQTNLKEALLLFLMWNGNGIKQVQAPLKRITLFIPTLKNWLLIAYKLQMTHIMLRLNMSSGENWNKTIWNVLRIFTFTESVSLLPTLLKKIDILHLFCFMLFGRKCLWDVFVYIYLIITFF